MDLDALREALEFPVWQYVTEDPHLRTEWEAARRLERKAARAVLDSEEAWWCKTHLSVGPAPGPGGNPGMWYCHKAEWWKATYVDGLIMCKRVRVRLLAEEAK